MPEGQASVSWLKRRITENEDLSRLRVLDRQLVVGDVVARADGDNGQVCRGGFTGFGALGFCRALGLEPGVLWGFSGRGAGAPPAVPASWGVRRSCLALPAQQCAPEPGKPPGLDLRALGGRSIQRWNSARYVSKWHSCHLLPPRVGY